MANFGNNDFLGHQKKRNFVYKPAINIPTERNCLSRDTGSCGPQIFTDRVSPHKRFKTSHDRFGKITDEIVAEEECRGLLLDAFDEELDDFDDDILTVEQIDECDRIASHELQSQICNAPFDDIKQTQEYISNSSPLQTVSCTVKEPDQGLRTDTCTWSTYNYQEDALCTSTFTRSAGGFASVSSRDRNVKPHCSLVSLPEENFHMKPPTSAKSYSVMVSSVGHGTNSFSAANNITGDILGNSCISPSIKNKELSFTKPLENDHVQTLRKELDKLKSENAVAKSRVKTLEEEKFSKDGEIKILRDSLEHIHAEEKRKQEEVKATQEQCARAQSERERDLERQVENLTTRIQFKEREILQMIEQSKRITSLIEGSPQKKCLNLSEAFPTGSSFFQKTSPEARVKSPRGKKNTTEVNFQNKASSQRLSQGEHSEAVTSSGGSTASLLQQIQTQKRETETIERNLCQCNIQFLPEVELVQKLLTNREKGLPAFNWECENSDFYENSIVALLKPNASFVDSDLFTQRTASSDTDIPHTLRLFETQASSRLQRCSKNIASSSSSHLGYDNQMVIQTLYELLNKSHTDCSLEGKNDPTLFLNLQPQNHLCTVINFLPLLELHISQYVEQRTETSDENVMSTCLPRTSSPVESPEPKDASGGDSEHAEKLALLQQAAVNSLKLLNILVLYSHEVRGCILKSATIVSGGNANEDGDAQRRETDDKISKAFPLKEENGTYSQHFLFPGLRNVVKKHPIPSSDNPVSCLGQLAKDDGVERTTPTSENECVHEVSQRTELLSYLFKLLAPQPKESTVVAYTTLQVLDSIARNCEGRYYTRLFPLLDDGLLSQYLSRDWCLTSLLLVTSLLTPLTRHSEIVRKLCSQSGECILLKIYQGWIYRLENVPSMHCQTVHLKIVAMVNNLLSNGHSSDVLFPVETECHCSIELIKCLVLMLDKELSFLSPLSIERLVENTDNSYSLMLVRQGVFLLTMLCLNDRLFVEHRLEVEHQYTNVVSSITRLYKRIPHLLSDAEVLAVQDLVDFEHIDGIEWTQDSDDEEDEVIEGMDVDE